VLYGYKVTYLNLNLLLPIIISIKTLSFLCSWYVNVASFFVAHINSFLKECLDDDTKIRVFFQKECEHGINNDK